MTEQERQAEFERIVARLVEMGAQRVIIFGSRARGDHRPDSDFDLIVVLPDDESIRYGKRLARLYEALVPTIAIDILVYTPDEFERLLRERAFVRQAVAEGRALHAA